MTLLYKGGDRDNLDNYRRISKLPCLAKILEILINNQLKGFLSIFSILSPHQSGFRASHSSISAITVVTNDIITALDKKKHCAALFVDLSQAFHNIYIYDMLSALNDCHAHLYADDTILYCIADTVQLASKKLQLSFHILHEALTDLKLVLNVKNPCCSPDLVTMIATAHSTSQP